MPNEVAAELAGVGDGVLDALRERLGCSISLRGKAAGSHDAKIGLQSRYNYNTYDLRYPGGSVYSDVGGGPLEGGLCAIDPATGNPVSGNGCYQRTDFEQGQTPPTRRSKRSKRC